MCFRSDLITCVDRNTSTQNELWKSIDHIICMTFYERCNATHEEQPTPSFIEIIKEILDRPEYKNNFSYKDFTNLLLGCGCCKRHSRGVFSRQQHVFSFDTSTPTTQTLEGKPCDCRCRMMARLLIGAGLG